jgi:hypothetical protein
MSDVTIIEAAWRSGYGEYVIEATALFPSIGRWKVRSIRKQLARVVLRKLGDVPNDLSGLCPRARISTPIRFLGQAKATTR